MIADHAVVLGASISGLLTARVLCDFYDKVSVVERDILPHVPAIRRGVPQGHHTHLLMRRGSRIMAELFPGLLEELVDDGASIWNDGDLSRMDILHKGHRLSRNGRIADIDSTTLYFVSRLLLEHHIRRRLLDFSNVVLLGGTDAVELTATARRDRVKGVLIHDRASAKASALDADLVVDATGRGSRAPTFLRNLGYEEPLEEQVYADVSYSSQRFQLPADAPGLVQLAGVGPQPGRPTAVVISRNENNTWHLTAVGVAGVEPPGDCAALLGFAQALAPEPIAVIRRCGQPIGEFAQYRVPSNRWRRYDKLRRSPAGFLVTGDAVCSFNPVYAQGMTVAAIGALVLRECLRDGENNLPRRFFAAAARVINTAWHMAAGADLVTPEIAGEPSMAMRLTDVYLDWVLSAAESRPAVVEQYLKMMNMTASPMGLFRPSVLGQLGSTHLHRLVGTSLRSKPRDRDAS